MYTPDRSQGCRAAASAISRWSQSRPFCCFPPRKWTWLTHPRCRAAHKKKFGCLSKYRHSPKIFCDTEFAGTYLYQSLEQHRERQLADIVFLRPRVCLAVRRKAPSARQCIGILVIILVSNSYLDSFRARIRLSYTFHDFLATQSVVIPLFRRS